MFDFGAPRPRRRLSLTPMIDVVFLLLVFFMLASRFGHETVLQLNLGGGAGAAWSGPPRLVDVGAAGEVKLNGVAIAPETLAASLAALMAAPGDAVVLRARAGSMQDLVAVMERLRAAGITNLLIVE